MAIFRETSPTATGGIDRWLRAARLKENPVKLVPTKLVRNERVRFLSVEEEEKLRAAILERFPDKLAEFDVAVNTGLRRSELYRARWENVDLIRGIFTVPPDKSGSTSHVPLNAAATQALAELHRQHAESGLVCGGSADPRWWFEQVVAMAGIERITWHSLRHTFASRLVMSGADVRTVAELLRDRTLAMVMRYAHLAPDYKLEAVKRMEEKFSTKRAPTEIAIPVTVN